MNETQPTETRVTFDNGGVRLSAVDYGGVGSPVLMLHGLAGRATEWRSTAAWLRQGFHAFALDQRGHGASAKSCGDFSRRAYVGDAAAAIEEIRLGPMILVGQSMGAMNAYLVAARHPHLVRGLVLIETGVTNSSATPEKIGTWLDSWPSPFPSVDAARQYFGGDSLTARTWAENLVHTPEGYRPEFCRDDMVASVRDYESAPNYEGDWARIACPTLLVLGEAGEIPSDDVDRMRALKPDVAVVTVPNAGHDLHLDNPSGWRSIAEPFLRTFHERT